MKRVRKSIITLVVLIVCIALWKLTVKPLNVENVSVNIESASVDVQFLHMMKDHVDGLIIRRINTANNTDSDPRNYSFFTYSASVTNPNFIKLGSVDLTIVPDDAVKKRFLSVKGTAFYEYVYPGKSFETACTVLVDTRGLTSKQIQDLSKKVKFKIMRTAFGYIPGSVVVKVPQ